jgi:hypothetical protein
MATTITFDNNINISAQKGDIAYYCIPEANGGFKTSSQGSGSNDNIIEIGVIFSVDNSTNTMVCEQGDVYVAPPPTGSFVLFSKDNRVNSVSPLGYYALAKFKNDSKVKSEMFATACEVFISSK